MLNLNQRFKRPAPRVASRAQPRTLNGHGRQADAAHTNSAAHERNRMATYVSAIHNHSIAGGTDNSEDAELPSGCPGWESNPHFTGFESARSASWRTGAAARCMGVAR